MTSNFIVNNNGVILDKYVVKKRKLSKKFIENLEKIKQQLEDKQK